MYPSPNNFPVPVPVPVLARPIAAASPAPTPTPIPTPVLAAPHVATLPVPLPVPLSPSSSLSYAPVVPHPIEAPTLAVPQVVSSARSQSIHTFNSPSPALSAPSASSSLGTSLSPAPFVALNSLSSSSTATQAVPLLNATPVKTAPTPWLQMSTTTPLPLPSALSTSPPTSIGTGQHYSKRAVTFSLPEERQKVPAAAAVPVIVAPPSAALTGPSPFSSALRLPTPAATPAVPTLTVPALSTPSPIAPAMSPIVTPSITTANAHPIRTVAATTARVTPVVPSSPHAASCVLARHVPSVPSVPTPIAPPLTSAAVAGGSSSLPSHPPAPFVVPSPQFFPEAALPVPVVTPRPFSISLPTLYATEEEAPSTPMPHAVVEEEALSIPDYSKWLYPILPRNAAAASPEMKFPLAEIKLPHTLPPPSLLQWCEADVLASLPLTLPPEYVIFGGARYSGAPLDLLRPLMMPRVPIKKTSAYYESTEAQRLQFLHDQLEVARNYLKVEARGMAEASRTGLTAYPSPSPLPPVSQNGEDVLGKPGEEDDLSKATIWTTAYFGSPQQLYRVLMSKKFDGVLSSAGYVRYHHRQWGLKRLGKTFVLGLGMKATALQFAAAAGKLDSVVLLLTNGAKDNVAPFLKEILLKESMAMIESICAPRVRPPRVSRPVTTVETVLQDPYTENTSTFVNQQVMSIDDVLYTKAGAAPYYAPTFSCSRLSH